jgi:hypothetical protein
MATITLDYDLHNKQAQNTLDFILSLGLFKPTTVKKGGKTMFEKRKELDSELNSYLVDLSGFKFNREEANRYEEVLPASSC